MTEEQERYQRKIAEVDVKLKRQRAKVNQLERERRSLVIEMLESTRDE
jgi:hypothetical protein